MTPSRLYIRIYLTVLGSLALVVVTLSALAFLGRLDTKGPMESGVARLAGAVLAGEIGADQRQAMLERIARAFDADIAIFDSQGRFVQGVGNRILNPDDEVWIHDRPRFRNFAIDLPHGERLVAYMARPYAPPRGHLIGAILLTVLLVGAGAYPVVRNLTRRLDRLRVSMDRWGNGELAIRAGVEGHDELAAVARTFNLAADRIETMIKSQKSLLANASHELRSPLARLRMATEMFNLNQNAKNQDEIVRNLAELDDIVEEILLKSRLDSELPPRVDQAVDLVALAHEEAARTRAEVQGEAGVVLGNERLLRRLMRNLLENAARHGAPPVVLTLEDHEATVRIRVRDHGAGISTADRQRVFEPFFRPAGRAEADGGWGLGLALVAEIARLHDGAVRVEETDGPGASFLVELAKRPQGRTTGPLS